jgi:SAM-dependent methyltransferase
VETRILYSPGDLDSEIASLNAMQGRSFEEWAAACHRIRFHEDVSLLPADPFSPAYRATQIALYHHVSGRPTYDPWTSEDVGIPFEQAIDPYPYPFLTKHPAHIGNHFIQLGHILLELAAAHPRGRKLVEYGCGTGFFTLMIAASGYDVTAIDINADALRVLDQLAATRKLKIRTFRGTFGQAPDETERFDLVLFYEAFHHCLDFEALLDTLHRRLTDEGAIVFANEAVYADFEKPWGLRLDGPSLFEIRGKGWFELGFREDFFFELLRRHGWSVTKQPRPPHIDLYVARPT